MSFAYFAAGALDPEMTPVLTSAFDKAWDKIKSSGSALAADDRASDTRERLARHLIAAVQAGECDPDRLVEDAVRQLMQPHRGAQSSAAKGPSA